MTEKRSAGVAARQQAVRWSLPVADEWGSAGGVCPPPRRISAAMELLRYRPVMSVISLVRNQLDMDTFTSDACVFVGKGRDRMMILV